MMDGSRFDAVTRSLAPTASRRGVLGVLVGAGVALVGRRTGAAACPVEQIQAAGGRCVCRSTGRPPVGGVCPCPAGQIRCGGVCQVGPCPPVVPCPYACTSAADCRDSTDSCWRVLDGGGTCGFTSMTRCPIDPPYGVCIDEIVDDTYGRLLPISEPVSCTASAQCGAGSFCAALHDGSGGVCVACSAPIGS